MQIDALCVYAGRHVLVLLSELLVEYDQMPQSHCASILVVAAIQVVAVLVLVVVGAANVFLVTVVDDRQDSRIVLVFDGVLDMIAVLKRVIDAVLRHIHAVFPLPSAHDSRDKLVFVRLGQEWLVWNGAGKQCFNLHRFIDGFRRHIVGEIDDKLSILNGAAVGDHVLFMMCIVARKDVLVQQAIHVAMTGDASY